MPTSRSRSFDNRAGITGTYQTFPPFPSVTIQSALVGPWGTCDDSVCAYKEIRLPNALLIVRKETWLPTFNGRFPLIGTPIKQLTNCPADYHPSEPDPGAVFPALSVAQQSQLAWEALAATNPNVAHVGLPTFLAELKDLPTLWKNWGDNLLKDVARGHITWRWALKPMIRDIRNMWNFTSAVNQRMRFLSALASGQRTFKRRANLRTNSQNSAPTTVGLKSVGATISGRRVVSYHEKVWCTVEWKLNPSVVIPKGFLHLDRLWHRAYKMTWGISSHDSLIALWEIMPWSWFVDWFLGVGTVLQATNNTIPLTWGPICVMRTTSAYADVQCLASSPDLSWCKPSGAHRQSQVRKQRLLVSPVLPFAPSFMPVFTAGQWSILGSLAILRGRAPKS